MMRDSMTNWDRCGARSDISNLSRAGYIQRYFIGARIIAGNPTVVKARKSTKNGVFLLAGPLSCGGAN